jgi:hypothetical protein
MLRHHDLLGLLATRHQEQVIARVESLPGAALSLMPLGFDFTLLCDARPIADRIAAAIRSSWIRTRLANRT